MTYRTRNLTFLIIPFYSEDKTRLILRRNLIMLFASQDFYTSHIHKNINEIALLSRFRAAVPTGFLINATS